MKAQLLYALLSSSIVTGAAWTGSNVVADKLPKKAREAVLAPGRTLVDKLEDRKDFRKFRKKAKKKIKKGKKQLKKATAELQDKLEDRDLPELDRLTRLYNVGAWAVAGFAICFLMTLILGVSSLKTALSLGVKVTLGMIFLQATLVLAGVLAFQHLTG